MSIRFGCCAAVQQISAVKAAGYDYFEFGFTTLTEMSEEDFCALVKTVEELDFHAEAFNGFFPGHMVLVGEQVDYAAIEAHARKGLARAARLGAKVAVIGSGKARAVPEGYDASLALQQFGKVVALCADIAAQYGIKVAVEPLNFKETNLINTVQEGADLCRRLSHPNAGLLVDLYHTYVNGEPVDAALAAKGMLEHVHYCAPDRHMPTQTDADITRQWAQALKACDYDGRISLEGFFAPDFEADIRRARELCRLFE